MAALTRPSTGRAGGWLLLAAALLAVAGLVTPRPLPLYDGVGFPDEPYRYVHPPAGARATKPPTVATGSSSAAGGVSQQSFSVDSAEQGPQVSVFVTAGTLHGPASSSRFTVRAAPLAPDRQPGGGQIDGNVYRVTAAAAGGGTVTYQAAGGSGSSESDVVMRASTARQPGPAVVYRPGPAQPWRALPTARVGNDIYRAALAGFGDYALAFGVAAPAPGAAGGGSGGGFPVLTVVLALVVVMLLGLVLAVRLSRTRAARTTAGQGTVTRPPG